MKKKTNTKKDENVGRLIIKDEGDYLYLVCLIWRYLLDVGTNSHILPLSAHFSEQNAMKSLFNISEKESNDFEYCLYKIAIKRIHFVVKKIYTEILIGIVKLISIIIEYIKPFYRKLLLPNGLFSLKKILIKNR